MSNKGAATTSSGSGLLIGGIGFVVAIAAAAMLFLRDDVIPSDAEVSEVVVETQSPEVSTVTLAPSTAEDAPVEGVAEDTPEAPADVAQEAEVAEEEAQGIAQTDAEDASDEAAPTIDEVRLDTSGVAVVAGRAEPGSTVDVIVDGEVVATAQADASGSFAALGIVEPSETARVLSLSSDDGDAAVVSKDEVIIAPLAGTAIASAQVETVPNEAAAAPELKDAEETNAASTTQVAVADDVGTSVATSQEIAETASQEAAPQSSRETEAVGEVATAAPITQPEAPIVTSNVEETTAPDDPAPQVALLKSTEDGVELLGTAPQPPRQILLDTIGYSDGGVVQLAGRASAEAVEVRVYLNNRVIANLPVDETGSWRGDLPNVDTGVYTLRVDAVNAAGGVTSRLETPFKREAPAVLAAAADSSDGPVSAITVQTGDTLWAIARDRYGEGVLYVRVFDANRSSIRNPDLIYPGQVFDLPDE